MSCREKKRQIQHVSQPVIETLSTTGSGNGIKMTDYLMNIENFQAFLAFVQLPQGGTPGAGNVPIAIRFYGVKDTGTPVPVLIAEKCLENADGDAPTGWNGKAFFEIDDTDIGSVLTSSGDASDFEAIQVEIEGPAATDYDVMVIGCNAKFASEQNIEQAFTYA